MAEKNEQQKAPPVAIYRALRQIEDMLTSSEGEVSVCTQGPESVLWQKWQFLKTSLQVRKQWKHLPEPILPL